MSDSRLYTSQEVADLVGISVQRVRQLRQAFALGQRLGRDWLYTAEDIDVIRNRPDGRRKENTPGQKPEGV